MKKIRTSQVKLAECLYFPEFLESETYLIPSSQGEILRIKKKVDNEWICESKDGRIQIIENLQNSEEYSLIFLINSDLDYKDPDVLFKVNNEYVIASPFDILGDQVQEAYIIDINPNQIGYKITDSGDLLQIDFDDIQNILGKGSVNFVSEIVGGNDDSSFPVELLSIEENKSILVMQ